MGWAFQGNPDKFDLDDYLSRYPELIYWRTPRYAADISLGDRAFIWRAGNESGAIAVGTVVELPTPATNVKHPDALGDDLWRADKPNPQECRTGIHIEELRIAPAEMVPRNMVKANPLLAASVLVRIPNGTVFKLSKEETQALEKLWSVSVINSVAPSISEGERKLRSHFLRERSPRLRADKIAAFRTEHDQLYCEICGHSEIGSYPSSFAEKMFEVHHRAPLAHAATPVRTTLVDLAVLCANCHRSVHATKLVEENFKILSEYFSKHN